MGPLFPLGDYSQNVLALQNKPKPPMVDVNFNAFNADHFFSLMKNIDTIPDIEVFNAIKNHIDLITERTLSNDKAMASVLAHPKFVDCYHKAMSKIPIDYDRTLLANKLSYEYGMVSHDKTILAKFKDISNLVNAATIQRLTQLGLSVDIASELAICRYSSRTELVNVQRLNLGMCKTCSSDVFTEQMIVWVYEQLFDRISELFIASMFEIYLDKEFNEYSEDFRDIYGNISLAILTILNNMPSTSIQQIIQKYIDRYNPWFEMHKVLPRFSLRSLSTDYERVATIVDKMIKEGYDIP